MQKFGDCTITYENDVDTLAFDWGVIHMLSDENATGSKSISFGTVRLEPGKGHIRHNHPDADEIIFVISGEGMQMLNDEEPVKVTPGACIWVPKAVYHSTVNSSDTEPMHLVVAYIPAGSEQALRDDPGVTITPASEK